MFYLVAGGVPENPDPAWILCLRDSFSGQLLPTPNHLSQTPRACSMPPAPAPHVRAHCPVAVVPHFPPSSLRKNALGLEVCDRIRTVWDKRDAGWTLSRGQLCHDGLSLPM